MFIHQFNPVHFSNKETLDIRQAGVNERCSLIEGDSISPNYNVVGVFDTISFLLVDLIPKCNFTFNNKFNQIILLQLVDQNNIFSFKKWL